ncbi:unnamed protein product [Caenorhabditis sp. 36 PRJEB53466]|nr:unnamed protein product [Caenorhabditis sp. 36 PRJEB53466]
MLLLLLLRLLTFSSIFIVGHSEVACNYGDNEYDGYCYQFVNQRVLFSDAQAYCATLGAIVVKIRGPTDGQWLASTAATKFHATYGNFWIGFHREGEQFVWEDGSEVNYLNWAQGYPFSGYDFVGAQLSNTKWVTVLSSQSLPFICSYQKGANNNKSPSTLPPTQPAAGVCDGADLLLGHRCYFFVPALLPHDQAVEKCAATGKTLAIFDDLSQINFVTSIAITKFSMTYGTFWIGLQKNTIDGKFYWPNGNEDTLKHWSPGYPFQQQTVVSQQVSNGKWKTSEAETLLPTVCSGYVQ